jgi:small subunit ribosomal protein S21
MVQVTVNEGDDLERVLRRFKRQVQKAGIFTGKKHYEKPSETRKRKRNAARRRNRRTRTKR